MNEFSFFACLQASAFTYYAADAGMYQQPAGLDQQMLGATQQGQAARAALMAAGPDQQAQMAEQQMVGIAGPNAMYGAALDDSQLVGAEGPVCIE